MRSWEQETDCKQSRCMSVMYPWSNTPSPSCLHSHACCTHILRQLLPSMRLSPHQPPLTPLPGGLTPHHPPVQVHRELPIYQLTHICTTHPPQHTQAPHTYPPSLNLVPLSPASLPLCPPLRALPHPYVYRKKPPGLQHHPICLSLHQPSPHLAPPYPTHPSFPPLQPSHTQCYACTFFCLVSQNRSFADLLTYSPTLVASAPLIQPFSLSCAPPLISAVSCS